MSFITSLLRDRTQLNLAIGPRMSRHPTFSPEEIRQAQAQLGLSDREFAPLLGITEQHLRRLKIRKPEAGSARQISPASARLLRAYLDGYRPPEWP